MTWRKSYWCGEKNLHVWNQDEWMFGYQVDPHYVNDYLSELQKKVLETEDRSCRNKIRVDGVTEEKGETWEDCENKVLEILRDKLEIEDVIRERDHRVKPYQKKKK